MSAGNADFDVLIVGAGLSGVGAAYYVQTRLPGRTYALLEGRDAIGGTWDLFRYPGIRSDSDLHTLGYAFKPWTDEQSIADGPAILRYIRETACENGIDRHIRFGHRVERAEWSTADARWTVVARRTDDDSLVTFTASFLVSAGGYYSYESGYQPRFEGTERFAGEIVHPQEWPEDLDYAGKRVVVIGSGATAVTLVPALAEQAEHVTMLQRSPTYVVSVPGKDPLGMLLRDRLSPERAYAVTRMKNVLLQAAVYKLSRRYPKLVRRALRAATRRQLPPGYDVDTHFNPRYDPWDQRLCAVPDGDLFDVLRSGRASIVTDRIATFTERGLRLESGAELEADVIVTATGLNLVAFGDLEYVVDGEPVVLSDRFAYKGMMLSDVPNFVFATGYTNASWTLKVDLVYEYMCRLMAHMDRHGYDRCVPVADGPIEERPLLDFTSGYVQRALDRFPKQGSAEPWQLRQSYLYDRRSLRKDSVEDGVMRFSRRGELLDLVSAGDDDDRGIAAEALAGGVDRLALRDV
jgi:cation diffusion facilitator CzcD-associated flavoprotein CzcO